MLMIYILEGCDCVGKTTFAEMLAEKTGYEIVKGSSFEISELGADGMFEHMMSLLDRNNIIIDRFFYSNLVYGELFKYPMMKLEQYDALKEKMNKKAFLIYLHAPLTTIRKRMENRGDDMIKFENVSDILSLYNATLNGSFRPKLHLSLSTYDSDFNIATAMVKEMADSDMFKTYIKTT